MIHRVPHLIRCRAVAAVGVSLLACFARADVGLHFDTNRTNQLSVTVEANGQTVFRTLGEDPFIYLVPFDATVVDAEDQVLVFEYFCPDGIDGLDVYYGPPIDADNFLSAGSLMKAEGWQPFWVDLPDASSGRWSPKFNLLRLDFGKKSGRTIRVRNLKLRPPNEAERRSRKERVKVKNRKQAAADIVTNYLASEMPVKIVSVIVDKETITINGYLNVGGKNALLLIEAQPWQELWTGAIPVVGKPERQVSNSESGSPVSVDVIVLDSGTFTARVPRFVDERDRITSRWAVVKKQPDESLGLASHYVYATDLTAACEHPNLDRKSANGIKGMGGVWANDILDELVELGVKHITDNVWLSASFSGTARSDWTRFQYNGRDWWVNPAFVNGHDRLIKFATDHSMVVSAIILVGFGDDGFAGTLQHPESDRAGQYAMPNLTSLEGAAAYEAAIYFLARRYAQPGDPHGRISNWIIHNEVDYGWVWTNMGQQPLPVFLDTYVRSMRVVHNIARQFNPHARTFISLTHSWAKPEDPTWKTYAPKLLLETLARCSKVEGEFEWGVAYHPYPQSLFKADTWNDTLPTDDFDTPLITPKNIAVLDQWMQRDEMLFRGKLRGTILSEQGFHTNDYSDKNERLQAAAFVYMWHKIRGLKTIEAFHNHRWVDHPHEGGLKLGIRTLPGSGKPYGEKKFGWEIYKMLDTPEETQATQFAKKIIGINSFDEISGD